MPLITSIILLIIVKPNQVFHFAKVKGFKKKKGTKFIIYSDFLQTNIMIYLILKTKEPLPLALEKRLISSGKILFHQPNMLFHPLLITQKEKDFPLELIEM